MAPLLPFQHRLLTPDAPVAAGQSRPSAPTARWQATTKGHQVGGAGAADGAHHPGPPRFVDVFSVDLNLAGPDGVQALPLVRRDAHVEG